MHPDRGPRHHRLIAEIIAVVGPDHLRQTPGQRKPIHRPCNAVVRDGSPHLDLGCLVHGMVDDGQRLEHTPRQYDRTRSSSTATDWLLPAAAAVGARPVAPSSACADALATWRPVTAASTACNPSTTVPAAASGRSSRLRSASFAASAPRSAHAARHCNRDARHSAVHWHSLVPQPAPTAQWKWTRAPSNAATAGCAPERAQPFSHSVLDEVDLRQLFEWQLLLTMLSASSS